MAKNYQIRWTKSDIAKLRYAVSNFNKKVREIEEANELNEFNNYLPDYLYYRDVKENIQTRRELNRMLTKLKHINKKNAFDIIYTESGDAVTLWEQQETKRSQALLERSIQRQIEREPVGQGMGNERRRELIAQLNEVQQMGTLRGTARKKLWAKIQKRGTLDYEFKMQVVFKENFLSTLRAGFQNEPYYKELMQKLSNMSPSAFFNFAYANNLVDWLAAGWYKLDQDKYSQILRNADIADIKDYIYGEYQD